MVLTASVKKKELTLQQAEMRTIRWMCGIKVAERFMCSELRDRLRIDDATVAQQYGSRWYGNVRSKNQNNLSEKGIDYEVEGIRPTGKPKKTWSEVLVKYCQTQQICKKDDIDHKKQRKLTKKDVV